MADYKATTAEFQSVANAIRTKGGTSAQLEWPTGFVSAVQAIPTGSGVVQPLSVTQNGTYNPPSGVDGYAPVTVNVSGGGGGSVTEVYIEPSSSDVPEGNVFVLLSDETDVEVKPECETPVSGIAGQNQSNAMSALSQAGTNPGGSYRWTTNDNNYNDLWIGADFGEAKMLNTIVIAPRTWNNNRQIYTVIFEASNDAVNWTLLGKANKKGNDLGSTSWFQYKVQNATAYRYYRLRTETDSSGKVNGSATFTIYGLGFLYTSGSPDTPVKAYYKKNGILYEI